MGETPAKEYRLKTGETVAIRTAVPDDAQVLLEHARIILSEDLYNLTTLKEFKMTVEKEQEWIQQHIDQPGQIALVAELDGSIVGVLNFENSHRERQGHVGVLAMSVQPDFRSKGIGTALLQSLFDWAKADPGIEKLTLSVFATNRPAVNLYEKMGFAIEGRRVRAIKITDGNYVDEIIMSRFVKEY